MLRGLTAGQIAEWEAFHALEPWGGLRDDLRAGTIAAAAVNSAPMRAGPAKLPGDFFPTLRPPKRKPAAADIRDRANAFFGGIRGR